MPVAENSAVAASEFGTLRHKTVPDDDGDGDEDSEVGSAGPKLCYLCEVLRALHDIE